MKKISTLEQLTKFTLEEEALRNELFNSSKQQVKGPKLSTLKSILAYSQALSVRKSENLDHIEMVLN